MSNSAELAVNASFAAIGNGKAATYTPPAGGIALACSIIIERADRTIVGLNVGRPMSEGIIIEVRRSQIAAPVKAGTFETAAERFTILHDPQTLDPDRLVWTCTVSVRAR